MKKDGKQTQNKRNQQTVMVRSNRYGRRAGIVEYSGEQDKRGHTRSQIRFNPLAL